MMAELKKNWIPDLKCLRFILLSWFCAFFAGATDFVYRLWIFPVGIFFVILRYKFSYFTCCLKLSIIWCRSNQILIHFFKIISEINFFKLILYFISEYILSTRFLSQKLHFKNKFIHEVMNFISWNFHEFPKFYLGSRK